LFPGRNPGLFFDNDHRRISVGNREGIALLNLIGLYRSCGRSSGRASTILERFGVTSIQGEIIMDNETWEFLTENIEFLPVDEVYAVMVAGAEDE